MSKRNAPDVGHDIKRKHLVGGTYKQRYYEKLGKGKSEKTKLGAIYVATPPAEGWPGGPPEKNGWKP